jgi:hypothetical protein
VNGNLTDILRGMSPWIPPMGYRVEKLSEFSWAVVRESDETFVSFHRNQWFANDDCAKRNGVR